MSIPAVDILLLGSPGTGKSTFLRNLRHVRDGSLQKRSGGDGGDIDLEAWPQTFSVTLFHRPYVFRVWASTSTLFTDPFPDQPHFAVVTYAVDDRVSLHNATQYWHKQYVRRYAHDAPVMLLGLKRDLRTADQDPESGGYVCVMPEEGLHAATEMRCDKYAECSAVTGELMWEVLEDISRVAALTTLGEREELSSCAVM